MQRKRCMEGDEGARSSQSDGLGDTLIRNDGDGVPILASGRARVMGDELEANKGESYRMYSGQDGFGNVPEKYAIVLSRATGVSGVSENDLNAVLERFERRVVRVWKQSRRERAEMYLHGE